MIKTPKFFSRVNFFSILLLPLSFVFFIATFVKKIFSRVLSLDGKLVICIGNVTVGGSGKTPVAIEIGRFLKQKGYDCCFVTKGYGRSAGGFFEVTNDLPPRKTGDEPRLLSCVLPTFVFSKALDLKNVPHKILIMDDGMQNYSLKKDFIILVLDSDFNVGNGFLLPAGPLRQTFSSGVRLCDVIVSVGDEKKDFVISKPVFYATVLPDFSFVDKQKEYVAFCGLANNDKFFDMLKKSGVKLFDCIHFKDHHFYTKKDVDFLKSFNKPLITTEKDFVKLNDFNCEDIVCVKISLDISRICDLTNKIGGL